MSVQRSSRTCFAGSRKWFLSAVVISFATVTVAGPFEEGQDQTGVVRSANQPIPGATISATQGSTIIVTTTDQNGHYSLHLGQGVWMVEVTMLGFQPAVKALTVSNTAQEFDFTLQLRELPTTPRRDAAEREGAGEQNQNEPASQLPNELEKDKENIDDPNEAFLLSGTLNKGASPNATPGSSTSDLSGQVVVQGGDTSSLNVPGFGGGGSSSRRSTSRSRVDSAAARQASNRRQANQIHGRLAFRVENSALNARPFSITGQDIPQPAYAQSRFNFSVGGPLGIPKIVKDPATFFFLSYSGPRYRNPYTAVETVPTESERHGNFSQSIQFGGPVQIYDPATHLPFPGNVIPESRIDPIALKLLSYFPLPNQPGLVNNYDLQASVPRNTDDVDLRVQRNITTKDRLAYSLTFDRRDAGLSQPFGFLDTTRADGLNTDLQWTSSCLAGLFLPCSTRLINTARVSFKRNRNETTPYFANGKNVALDLGI